MSPEPSAEQVLVEIADELRSEADTPSRYGQHELLNCLANRLEALSGALVKEGEQDKAKQTAYATLRDRVDELALTADRGRSWESIYKQLRSELNVAGQSDGGLEGEQLTATQRQALLAATEGIVDGSEAIGYDQPWVDDLKEARRRLASGENE